MQEYILVHLSVQCMCTYMLKVITTLSQTLTLELQYEAQTLESMWVDDHTSLLHGASRACGLMLSEGGMSPQTVGLNIMSTIDIRIETKSILMYKGTFYLLIAHVASEPAFTQNVL